MRVLYVTYHPDALSESYIRTEVEWMQDRGVDVCMLYQEPHPARYPNSIPPEKLLTKRSLKAAVEHFQPDVVHFEWLTIAVLFEHELTQDLGVPITIRGHSFDFSSDRAKRVATYPSVKRVWLFPHFHRLLEADSMKFSSLSACFSEKYFSKDETKTGDAFVMRAMAGVRGKNHEKWFDVARALPEVPFFLVVTTALPPDNNQVRTMQREAPANVRILCDLQHEDVYRMMRQASLYFVTEPVRHMIGQPISIAQALGNGLPVLVPENAAMRRYAGAAGLYFRTARDARDAIKSFFADTAQQETLRKQALYQSRSFHADVVLPTVVTEWEKLVASTRNAVGTQA